MESVEDPHSTEDSDMAVFAEADDYESDEPGVEPEPPSDDDYVDV